MRHRLPALTLCAALILSACALTQGPPAFPDGTPAPPDGTAPVAAPAEKPYTPAPKQFRLSAASQALVTQAHQQSAGGDYGGAAATLERAQRIEPDNPLLWIELGRVRLGENNPAQAEAMGRKALALATGDPSAQSQGWHLVADSLRARGRNGEAADADRRAAGATTH